MILNIFLVLILLILYSSPYKELSAVLGVILTITVLIHIYLNRNNINFHPKSKKEKILLPVNLLLGISYMGSIISGIILLYDNSDLIFRILAGFSCWFLVLNCIHISLNLNEKFTELQDLLLQKHKKLFPIIMTALFTIALIGAWLFNESGSLGALFFMGISSKSDNIFINLLCTLSYSEFWVFLSYELSNALLAERSSE